MEIIYEGNARINVHTSDIVSKKLPVFYNPIMSLNRDISIILLRSVAKKDMQIALPLAATGVRGVRMLAELPADMIKSVSMNDISTQAVRLMEENLALNSIDVSKAVIENKDANDFVIGSTGFDYIDIDPFGSPNFLLDSSVKRLARDGILAVTATDTGCLCGTFPDACARKYFAKPIDTAQMHEWGLRILIRKVQLIAAQYDKALRPIFSYSKDHYLRAFFRNIKGKKEVDKEIEFHKYILHCPRCGKFGVWEHNRGICGCGTDMRYAGPLYAGALWERDLVEDMHRNSTESARKLIETILEESKINQVGFYDIHALSKAHRIGQIHKLADIIRMIKERGYGAATTHFRAVSIRSDISHEELMGLIES